MRNLVLCGALIGCGSGMSTYEVNPVEGTWDYSELARTGGDCEFDIAPAGVPEAPTELRLREFPTGFAVSVADSEAVPCTAEFEFFECKPAVTWSSVEEEVTFRLAVVTEGEVLDRDWMEGEFTYEYRCNGAGCPEFLWEHELGSMPCTVEGTFEAQAL